METYWLFLQRKRKRVKEGCGGCLYDKSRLSCDYNNHNLEEDYSISKGYNQKIIFKPKAGSHI